MEEERKDHTERDEGSTITRDDCVMPTALYRRLTSLNVQRRLLQGMERDLMLKTESSSSAYYMNDLYIDMKPNIRTVNSDRSSRRKEPDDYLSDLDKFRRFRRVEMVLQSYCPDPFLKAGTKILRDDIDDILSVGSGVMRAVLDSKRPPYAYIADCLLLHVFCSVWKMNHPSEDNVRILNVPDFNRWFDSGCKSVTYFDDATVVFDYASATLKLKSLDLKSFDARFNVVSRRAIDESDDSGLEWFENRSVLTCACIGNNSQEAGSRSDLKEFDTVCKACDCVCTDPNCSCAERRVFKRVPGGYEVRSIEGEIGNINITGDTVYSRVSGTFFSWLHIHREGSRPETAFSRVSFLWPVYIATKRLYSTYISASKKVTDELILIPVQSPSVCLGAPRPRDLRYELLRRGQTLYEAAIRGRLHKRFLTERDINGLSFKEYIDFLDREFEA